MAADEHDKALLCALTWTSNHGQGQSNSNPSRVPRFALEGKEAHNSSFLFWRCSTVVIHVPWSLNPDNSYTSYIQMNQ